MSLVPGRRIAAVTVLALSACHGTSQLAERSGTFSVGDHALALSCLAGHGPRVVIDAGLGESSAEWKNVVQLLDGLAVCTFDRAGYGASEPGPEPRTPQRNAADLARLLDTARIEQPIVLVGHSLGGLNALAFWHAFPERVKGLVLLDPPPRAWLEGRRFPGLWEMAVTAGRDLESRAATMNPATPDGRALRAMASEHVGMLQEGAAVSAIDSFGDLPLLVIASGRANPAFGDSASAYQAFWGSESEAIAARSTRGRFVRLDQVGHNMNAEAPQRVADLIRGFVTGLGASR